jgi:extracellular elastinolytic metalloproteinase
MRLKLVGGAAVLAATAVLLPGSALSVAQIQDSDGLADFDSRTGQIAPTKQQRAAARNLRANVSWGQFGTPSTISRRGQFLAKNIKTKTPSAAARAWLRAHRRLFGLGSLNGLVLESANRFAGAKGYAVNLRQQFKGLPTSDGGLITIGVSRAKKANRWNIAYVSSTLTRASSLAGSVQFSAAEGWARAAKVGRVTRSVANILSRKRGGAWTRFAVAGLDQPQLVRLIAFPTVREGVVPAYESYVLDGKKAKSLRTFIDARNGRLLARYNTTDNLASGFRQAAVTVVPFSGTLPGNDGGCGPQHPVTVPAGVRALSGFANATNPLTDIILELWRVGTPNVLLIQADTVFTPERFRFEPAGGVPPGDYFSRVCDFPDGGAPPAPLTYSGTFTLDDSPAPPAYLAKWKVSPAGFPLGALPEDPWGRPATDTRETWCWRAAAGCDRVIGNLASRAPWDHDMVTDTPTFTTRGNNAITAESWSNPNVPGPFAFQPNGGPTRDYSFPWTDSWNQSDCNASQGFIPGVSWDVSAAVTNLFMAHNRMHDFSYFLGFTEENWNAQEHNFGLTEPWRQNDAVLGDAQSGAIGGTRNNANMSTVPEGGRSVSNMYFFGPQAGSYYPPCADGDFDMSVIGHEYGHMIENRMIGKGVARAGFHAGSMGEAFGDLVAMEYLTENSFETGAATPYVAGAYDSGNKFHGTRNYDMSRPMAGGVPEPGKELLLNSLNFGNIGYDVTGNEVHSDGEIWVATNFRLRQLLGEKYDRAYPVDDEELQSDCANGLVNVTRCPGNRRWAQLYFDAMLLMPPNTSMVQARDAILAADLMRFGGANQKELWLGFGRSGLGRNAASTNGSVNSDTDPLPDFDAVGTEPATVTFQAKNYDGDPVNARIYVGHYEARISPIADTNPATTASSNVDDVANFAPGKYEFLAQAPGYGFVRFSESFKSGRNETIKIKFPTNWASITSGATATTTSGAATVNNLIDDTEATNWNAPATNTAGAISVDGKSAVIDLAGTDEVSIRYIQVSAMLAPGNNRFAALRSFELWACNNKGTLNLKHDKPQGKDCSVDANYTKVYTSPANAFPGSAPRPMAPALVLRRFDVPDFDATHLKFVVKTSQCTGGPAYQGDQDADPATPTTDCDTNVATNSTRSLVRSAELQVFRLNPDIDD